MFSVSLLRPRNGSERQWVERGGKKRLWVESLFFWDFGPQTVGDIVS